MLGDAAKKEVDRLAALLREDRLAPEDSQRLVEIIRHHPSARRRLVEHLYLDANLRDAVPTLESLEETTVVSPWVFRGALGGLAAAALVALMLVVKAVLFVEEPESVAEADEVSEADAAGIAVISNRNEVIWGEGTTLAIERLESGVPVGPGVLEVEAGAVQIDFYSGATVILKGPARMELESPECGRLEYGDLWAHVPPPARGFRVETVNFEVVDLGTEFGVRVSRDGEGEVHVLDGEVEVTAMNEEAGLKDHSLKTGEGVRVGGDETAQEIAADPKVFEGTARFSKGVRERFEAWRSYHRELAADPDTLVSFTFEGESSWERTVVNGAAHGPEDTDGAVVGCEWTEGRWPGKAGLSYSNSSNRVRLDLPGEYEEITMACWLKVSDGLVPHAALLNPETIGERFVHWTLIRSPGDALHLHFSETEGRQKANRNHYHCKRNLLGEGGPLWGEWMHVAVTYDPKTYLVTHYQNGVEVGTNPIETPRLVGFGTVDIGNWPYKEWAAGTEFELRHLEGVLDEFVIMKRAMTADEIAELHEVGRP